MTYCSANDRGENKRIVQAPDGGLIVYHARLYIPYFLEFPGQKLLLKHSALIRLLNTRLAPYLERRGVELKEFDLDRDNLIRNAILDLRDLSERDGARFLMVVVPLFKPEVLEYAWIMNVAQSEEIDFIDLKNTFSEAGYDQFTSRHNDGSVDYVHPNQLGHQVMTELIYNRLRD